MFKYYQLLFRDQTLNLHVDLETCRKVANFVSHLNGHESEQVLGVADGLGSLVWYKELDTAEQLN